MESFVGTPAKSGAGTLPEAYAKERSSGRFTTAVPLAYLLCARGGGGGGEEWAFYLIFISLLAPFRTHLSSRKRRARQLQGQLCPGRLKATLQTPRVILLLIQKPELGKGKDTRSEWRTELDHRWMPESELSCIISLTHTDAL